MKAVFVKQDLQQHGGFVCTDKDQIEMRFHDRYKTMLINERVIHLTIRDEFEEKLMDREQIYMASKMLEQEQSEHTGKTQQGLSYWEARKINE